MATAAMAGTKETIMGTMAFITPRVTRRRSAHLAPATAQSLYEDPLDADRSNDMVVATTRRSLCRVALIASETATRFAREGLLHDPMAWLLAPRALFSGSTTLEACLERGHCEHAILLHGLSLGFDASPP